MRGYKRFRVFPNRDLRATQIEVAVLDTTVLQRLRNIKQLGQSSITYPTAEHSRFAHSLGTLYWVSKMLSYLKENYFSEENCNALDMANGVLKKVLLRGVKFSAESSRCLEISLFEQLVRLYALTHDISHLPYGHTLEDQAQVIGTRHDEDPERIEWLYAKLIEELDVSPHFGQDQESEELRSVAKSLLRKCESIYLLSIRLKSQNLGRNAAWSRIAEIMEDDFLPFLSIVHDLVSNTICADLIDYLHRDSLFTGMPWTVDKALLSHLKIVTVRDQTAILAKQTNGDRQLRRLGVAVVRSGKLRHDVLTAVLSMLRARYDITEKVYYHHSKCAADALLEKIIREAEIKLEWRPMLERSLGDEGFMQYLMESIRGKAGPELLLRRLQSRHLPKVVYRLRFSPNVGKTTRKAIENCRTPEGRLKIEAEIAERINSELKQEHVIISCPPRKMQLKQALALVEWVDGQVLELRRLPEEKKYLSEVKNLTDRYLDLWSLSVYLDHDMVHRFAHIVERACASIFGRAGDPVTAEYVRARYKQSAQIRDLLTDFVEEAETHVLEALAVASGGGDPSRERNPQEVTFDVIQNLLDTKKKKPRGDHRSEEQLEITPHDGDE